MDKEELRELIREKTKSFLSSGGKIQKLKTGFAYGFEFFDSDFLRDLHEFEEIRFGKPQPKFFDSGPRFIEYLKTGRQHGVEIDKDEEETPRVPKRKRGSSKKKNGSSQ